MTNLSPAQERVVKAMQEGATLFDDYMGYYLSIAGISKDISPKTVRTLINRNIIERMDYKQYTLTDAGKKIEL